MAIEVKKMIIKSTLVHGNKEEEHSDLSGVDIEFLKEEVMEECRKLIEQSFSELRER